MNFDEFASMLSIKVKDDCAENKGEVIDDRYMSFRLDTKASFQHPTSETMSQ